MTLLPVLRVEFDRQPKYTFQARLLVDEEEYESPKYAPCNAVSWAVNVCVFFSAAVDSERSRSDTSLTFAPFRYVSKTASMKLTVEYSGKMGKIKRFVPLGNRVLYERTVGMKDLQLENGQLHTLKGICLLEELRDASSEQLKSRQIPERELQRR